eukprot:jgi/Botrbrau1/7230/Bobra.0021s0015.1
MWKLDSPWTLDFWTSGLLALPLCLILAVHHVDFRFSFSVLSFVLLVMPDPCSYCIMVGTPIRSIRLGSGNTGGGLPVGLSLSLRMLEGLSVPLFALSVCCCALPSARGRTGIRGGVCSEMPRQRDASHVGCARSSCFFVPFGIRVDLVVLVCRKMTVIS